MIHYVVMLYRRADLTQAQFEDAWLGDHHELARRLPGLVSTHFLPRVQRGDGDVGPHGIGRLVFESTEALELALAGDEARALREHTASFADSDASIRMIARDA